MDELSEANNVVAAGSVLGAAVTPPPVSDHQIYFPTIARNWTAW